MKKYVKFSVMIATLLMFCLNFRTVSAADSTVIYLQTEMPEEQGDVVVQATCEAQNAGKLTNGKIRIKYDADKLKLERSEVGAALEGFMCQINDCIQGTKEEGEVVLAFASSEEREVNGSMIQFTFSMKKDTVLDSTALTVTVEELKRGTETVDSQVLETKIQQGSVTPPIITPVETKTDINEATLAKIKNQHHTTRKIRPEVKLTYNGVQLTEGKDYALSYKNNKKTGKAEVTIHGTGDFTGSRKAYFYIVPAKPVLKSVSSPAKGKIKIRWKKVRLTTGYEIQISRSKKFKKSVKKILVKKAKRVKKVVKAKTKKTFYVRVRAYKTVDGVRRYGSYSKRLKVRVK